MRKIRRKRRRKNRVLVVSAVCLLLCLCVGYAAFQTNISITAKGNAFCSGQDATDKIIADSLVDSGSGLSGLYEDEYEDGRYVYRGASVNNYITFDGEPWRIIAIESDETLKIMRNDNLGNVRFDPAENRIYGYCSQGNALTYGCNVWAATSTMINTTGVFTSADGNYYGEVTSDSYLNTYLNEYYYYNDLSSEARSLIEDYIYNIGSVLYNDTVSTIYTISNQLDEEDDYKWSGKVALINLSDYIRSNSNDDNNCNMLQGSRSSGNYQTCKNTTWMSTSLDTTSYWWTITPYGATTYTVWYVYSTGYVGTSYANNSGEVHPVVHLKANLKLCGSGTEEDPYTIVD